MSDGRLVVQSNNEGVPFVLASPDAGDQQGHRCASPASCSTPAASRRRPGGPESPMSDPRPIGVFDSGVGGLTVLREIVRRSPAESTIYLGDNARAPYGVRTDDEVLAFSTQSLDLLAERDVKAIVVACNTSTAVAHRRAPAALRPADPRRHPARAPRRRRWPPATGGSGSSPRRRPSARTPTSGRSRTRTRRSRSTSTRRRRSCRWSRPAS